MSEANVNVNPNVNPNVNRSEIVVAGHICLDVIPTIRGSASHQALGELLAPGKLIGIGPALLSTGGAVSNTGLALHRLGLPVSLMGKVGDDLFGDAILRILQGYSETLAGGMIAAPGEHTSYTIVISPPGVDRIFLHCTGANDTFAANDVPADALEGARLFHFGYPPLMRGMFENDGSELVRLLSAVKQRGLTVSLDMALPDPDSPAGRADWRTILTRVLPYVDLFLPSFEELLFMLRPNRYRELEERHGVAHLLAHADGPLLGSLSEELLGMGTALAGIKLGEHGLYVRTATSLERLSRMGLSAPADRQLENWLGRELLAPCFEVDVVGTTGAGDCTIAGFIAGLSKRLPIEDTLLGAVGVGACNVQHADAVNGVPAWEDVQERIRAGWNMRETVLALPGWTYNGKYGIWEKTNSSI